MIYFLSFLMVSSLRYFSFKEFNIKNQKFSVLVALILIGIVIAERPNVLLFLIFIPYVFSGPIVSLYFFYKKPEALKDSMEPLQHIDGDYKKGHNIKDQKIIR